VRFELAQRYAADADALSRAYADPALYEAFTALPRAGRPMVVSHLVGGDGVVELEVHWAFAAPLSSAARAVVDPTRLTWVQASRHDLAARTVEFRMLPDHYADRFACSGAYRFEPDGSFAARRVVSGDLRVKAPLVARAVEKAILSGLEEQLASEVPVVEAFVAGG